MATNFKTLAGRVVIAASRGIDAAIAVRCFALAGILILALGFLTPTAVFAQSRGMARGGSMTNANRGNFNHGYAGYGYNHGYGYGRYPLYGAFYNPYAFYSPYAYSAYNPYAFNPTYAWPSYNPYLAYPTYPYAYPNYSSYSYPNVNSYYGSNPAPYQGSYPSY